MNQTFTLRRSHYEISPSRRVDLAGRGPECLEPIEVPCDEAREVLAALDAALPVDVAWVSEYGLTQKLSNSIRVF